MGKEAALALLLQSQLGLISESDIKLKKPKAKGVTITIKKSARMTRPMVFCVCACNGKRGITYWVFEWRLGVILSWPEQWFLWLKIIVIAGLDRCCWC
jgi:hypothetical protein